MSKLSDTAKAVFLALGLTVSSPSFAQDLETSDINDGHQGLTSEETQAVYDTRGGSSAHISTRCDNELVATLVDRLRVKKLEALGNTVFSLDVLLAGAQKVEDMPGRIKLYKEYKTKFFKQFLSDNEGNNGISAKALYLCKHSSDTDEYNSLIMTLLENSFDEIKAFYPLEAFQNYAIASALQRIEEEEQNNDWDFKPDLDELAERVSKSIAQSYDDLVILKFRAELESVYEIMPDEGAVGSLDELQALIDDIVLSEVYDHIDRMKEPVKKAQEWFAKRISEYKPEIA